LRLWIDQYVPVFVLFLSHQERGFRATLVLAVEAPAANNGAALVAAAVVKNRCPDDRASVFHLGFMSDT
jgi:hypothetical protein